MPTMLRVACFLLVPLTLIACGDGNPSDHPDDRVSGRLEAGLRVLTFDPTGTDQELRVYRGDYVRPEIPGGEAFTLEIPELGVARSFPATGDASPYFKVPEAGRFAFRLGEATGTLEAIEYRSARYREVLSEEAARFVANVDPLILDVRTPREFAGGRIEGATLVPVQVLARRIDEIPGSRDRPVLVYCRTGNRSTVAAKMLNDAGFTRVVNLRHGIVEWRRAGLPVVR